MSENKEKKKILLIGGGILTLALGTYLYIKYKNSTIINPKTDILSFLEEREDFEKKLVDLYDLAKERFSVN